MQVGNLRYEVKALLWAVVLCLGSPTAGHAGEGALHTGEGEPLSSIGLTLDLRETGPETRLQFEFGFGTDEIEAPGTFFDSFSVTLQTADGASTALLVTADLLGRHSCPSCPLARPNPRRTHKKMNKLLSAFLPTDVQADRNVDRNVRAPESVSNVSCVPCVRNRKIGLDCFSKADEHLDALRTKEIASDVNRAG